MLDSTTPDMGIVAAMEVARAPDGSRQGPRRFWTTAEIAILRRTYPEGGVPACLPLLPGRSASAIYNRAMAKGLAASPKKQAGIPRERWKPDPRIDDVIRRRFPACKARGDATRLAHAIGWPRWKLSRRAAQLGLSVPRFKPPEWQPAELALLTEHGPRVGLEGMQRLLKRAGFVRSLTSIKVKLKREAIRREVDVDGFLSSANVAEVLGVEVSSVSRWIEQGMLVGRRGAGCGMPYRVAPKELRRFIIAHTAHVDFRKVEKFFLVELLTGSVVSNHE